MMDYGSLYDKIVNNAKCRGLNKKSLDFYTEKHHIVPRCLGGVDDNSNYVLLTGREHYICHWLLWKANKDNKKLFGAYHKMVYQKTKFQDRTFKITSKQYSILKQTRSDIMKENNPTTSGSGNPFYGKKHTPETREKIKLAYKKRLENGYTISEETRIKMSLAHKGKQCGDKNPMYKKIITEEHRENLRRRSINKNNKPTKCFVDGQIFDTILSAWNHLKLNKGYVFGKDILSKQIKKNQNGWYIIDNKENL